MKPWRPDDWENPHSIPKGELMEILEAQEEYRKGRLEAEQRMKDDIQLTPKHCECWSCRANRGMDKANQEWRKPTEAEADAIEKATCTCHIDDGPACPVHVADTAQCETDGQQGE